MFEQIITLISLWSPFGHFVAFFNLYFIFSRISNNIYKLWLFKKDCLKFTYHSDKISRFCRFCDLFRSDQIMGYFPLALMVNSESAAQVCTDWAHSCARNFHVLCSCCPAGRLCFHVSSCSTQWDPKKACISVWGGGDGGMYEHVPVLTVLLGHVCSPGWTVLIMSQSKREGKPRGRLEVQEFTEKPQRCVT